MADIDRPLSLDTESLRWFLLLGFVPGSKTLFRDVERLPSGSRIRIVEDGFEVIERLTYDDLRVPDSVADLTARELVSRGGEILAAAAAKLVDPGKTIGLPLSAGMDSRAILGGLLEAVGTNSIVSYTFGAPGAFDYEIARNIAKEVGLRHVSVNLEDFAIDLDALIDTARRSDGNVFLFDTFFNHRAASRIEADEQWYGFMGDALSGGHLPPSAIPDEAEEVRHFLARNNSYNPGGQLVNISLDEACGALRAYVEDFKTLSLSDRLDLYHRQEGLISHVLFPTGAPAKLPFLDPDWMRFILSVAPGHRRNARVYGRIICDRFPELAKLPSSTYRGLPLTTPEWRFFLRRAVGRLRRNLGIWNERPFVKYIDFSQSLRSRPDLHDLAEQAIADLEVRRILDEGAPGRLWREHQDGQADHGMVLLLLTSLETILKAFDVRT